MPVNQIRRNGSFAPLSAHYYKDDAMAEAGERAELLYVRGLAFCADVLSDGKITDSQLTRFVGVGMRDPKARAERLVEVGLWERNGVGYAIRNWSKWNRSKAEIEQKQKDDVERKQEEVERRAAARRRALQRESERNPNGIEAES